MPTAGSLPFAYVIGDRPPMYRETLAEGMQLFLNPRAETPLEPQGLPAITYNELLDDGNVMTTFIDGFQPFVSQTMVFEHKDAAVFARYQQMQYLGRVPPWSEALAHWQSDAADG